MSTGAQPLTIGTATKIAGVIVPLFATAAVALYRVDVAEDRIQSVEQAVELERQARDEALEKIATGQREMLDGLTEIKIKVGVLCHAVDGARCP